MGNFQAEPGGPLASIASEPESFGSTLNRLSMPNRTLMVRFTW